jgi:hypothetical protein
MPPEISPTLAKSKKMRIPVFEPATGARTKIDQLENYTLETAFMQGELEEERLEALRDLAQKRHEWDHLDGWEGLKRTRTEAAVQDAKRQIRPELYDQIQDLDWTVKRLTEEIDRLERDATKTSRVYSMITGS